MFTSVTSPAGAPCRKVSQRWAIGGAYTQLETAHKHTPRREKLVLCLSNRSLSLITYSSYSTINSAYPGVFFSVGSSGTSLDLDLLSGHRLCVFLCVWVRDHHCPSHICLPSLVLSRHTYLGIASCDCVKSLGDFFFRAAQTSRGKVSLVICDNTRVNGCCGAWEILLLQGQNK